MPDIPTIGPYVSPRVSHDMPKLAPELNMHMADQYYQAKIQQWDALADAAKRVEHTVGRLSEKIIEDQQAKAEVDAFHGIDEDVAAFKIKVAESLAKEQDATKHLGIYKSASDEFASQMFQKYQDIPERAQRHLQGNLINVKEGLIPFFKQHEDALYKQSLDAHSVKTAAIMADTKGGEERYEQKVMALEDEYATMKTYAKRIPGGEEALALDQKENLHKLAWGYASEHITANPEKPKVVDEAVKLFGKDFDEAEKHKLFLMNRAQLNQIAADRRQVEQDAFEGGLQTLAGVEKPPVDGSEESTMNAQDEAFAAQQRLLVSANVNDVIAQVPGINKTDAVKLFRMIEVEREDIQKKELDRTTATLQHDAMVNLPEMIWAIENNTSTNFLDYATDMEISAYLPPGIRGYVRSLIINKTKNDAKVPDAMKMAFGEFAKKLGKDFDKTTQGKTRWISGNAIPSKFLTKKEEIYDPGWFTSETYKNTEATQQARCERYTATRNWAKNLAMQPGMTPEKFRAETGKFFDEAYYQDSWDTVLGLK